MLIVALLVAGGSSGAGAASSGTVVGATVPSATSINASGCVPGVVGRTNLGVVLPGATVVSSSDCTITFSSSNDTSMLQAFQADGMGTAMARLPDGGLDTTFDVDGKQTTPIFAASDYGADVALWNDKVVVAAVTRNGATDDFAVVRYNADGSLDTSLDGDGIVVTSLTANNDTATSIEVLADGRMLVGGYTGTGSNDDDFAMVRYNVNGTLDTTWDGDGIKIFSPGPFNDHLLDMALQPDGKVVAVGSSNMGGTDFRAVRLSSSGALDTNADADPAVHFDTDGMQTTNLGTSGDRALGVAIQGDGKIVLAGSTTSNGGDIGLVRYSASGALDTNADADPGVHFDTDGILLYSYGAGSDLLSDVMIQQDGKIVAVGEVMDATSDMFALRLNPLDASYDVGFDGDGRTRIPVGAASDIAYRVLQQSDGRLLVLGNASMPGVSDEFAVARLGADGALDMTFDTDGKVITSLTTGQDWIKGAALLPDGKIVVAGVANGDVGVVRYALGTSVPDWGGTWAAASLFGACLHDLAAGTATWTVAGAGNCTTGLDANWNALPTSPVKLAQSNLGATSTATLRFGFKAATNQPPGTYNAWLSFQTLAPAV